MSINLQDVVDAIERFDEWNSYQAYYYRKKDKIIDFFSPEWMSGEVDDDLDQDNNELILLPNVRDLDEYAILENFILQLSNRTASAILYNCIQGKGAFKRFKETCDLLGLLPDYWNFQHSEHVQIAREFCEQHDIDYIEKIKEDETAGLSVMELIRKFVNDRDWDQFHTPDNLAKSISIEANELLECFQWNADDYKIEHVEEELADVMIYCLQMCDKMNIDPERIMRDKMKKNAKKYPVDKAKGNCAKYDEF